MWSARDDLPRRAKAKLGEWYGTLSRAALESAFR